MAQLRRTGSHEVRKKLPTANVDRSAFRLALVNADLIYYFTFVCVMPEDFTCQGESMPTQWVNTVCQTVLPVKVKV